MYLIRKYTSLGFKEIGHYFGNRDHTTIMHGASVIAHLIAGGDAIAERVAHVRRAAS